MQLMVQRRIGFDHCAAHLRTVDPDYRLQDMTLLSHSFYIYIFLHDLRDAGIFSLHVTYASVLYSHDSMNWIP
jgi:hypothetical protein